MERGGGAGAYDTSLCVTAPAGCRHANDRVLACPVCATVCRRAANRNKSHAQGSDELHKVRIAGANSAWNKSGLDGIPWAADSRQVWPVHQQRLFAMGMSGNPAEWGLVSTVGHVRA